MADQITGEKCGGQTTIGGLHVIAQRNFFGAQLESFECDLAVPFLDDPDQPFRGIFIRAPVIVKLLNNDDEDSERNKNISEESERRRLLTSPHNGELKPAEQIREKPVVLAQISEGNSDTSATNYYLIICY